MAITHSEQASLPHEPPAAVASSGRLRVRLLRQVRAVGQHPLVAVVVPAAILLLAFLTRIVRLGDANLWWDEALAVWAVRKNLLETTLWTAGDVHPPLYFWSLWGWIRLVGQTEFAMRMLSVAFGVLTVAAVHALGTLVAGRLTGSLAALLTSLARFHIWWSQEMRMYVLAGLLCTLSLYFFLRWIHLWQEEEAASPRLRRHILIGYVLASTGALYTIYLTGAVLLVENVVVLVALLMPGKGKRRPLAEWVIAEALIALPVGAWLWLSWGRMQTWSVSEPIGLSLFAQIYATLLTTGVSTNIEQVIVYAIGPFAMLALAAVLYLPGRSHIGKRHPLDALTLLLGWTIPALVIYLATMPRSIYYTPKVEARYFLPFAPAFWVLLAWAVGIIGRRWRVLGWICGAGLLALWIAFLPGHYDDRILRDELQSMVSAIVSQAGPEDVVLLDSGSRYPIFDYYYQKVPYQGERPKVLEVPPEDELVRIGDLDAILSPGLQNARRVWLAEVDVNLTDPDRLVRRWLEERYPSVLSHGYAHNALFLYDKEGIRPGLAPDYVPQTPRAIAVDDGLLRGWELPVTEYAPGDQVHVALLWDVAPRAGVRLTLRDGVDRIIMASEATAVSQGTAVRQQIDFDIVQGTPSGGYRICLGEAPILLGTLEVVGATSAPSSEPDVAVGATFAQGIALEGYSLMSLRGRSLQTVAPGDPVILDLYWRADASVEDDLIVFTHLLGQAFNPATQGPVWGQHDSRPSDGGCPTRLWHKGDQIVDRHVIVLDEAAPDGDYVIEIGMYAEATGARLRVTLPATDETAGRVLLATTLHVSEG